MRLFSFRGAVVLAGMVAVLAVPASSRSVQATAAPTVVGLPGYRASVFAQGTDAYSHPDSLTTDGRHVYAGYQNVTAKDGADQKSSTVVEYSLGGKVIRTFSVLGHCDGLRFNPYTRQLWALSDEDGSPHLTVITPASGATRLYRTLAAPHGGGYDDLAFTGGMALIDASNPGTNAAGVNTSPALDKVTLIGGRVRLTPVLMGNARAIDLTTQHTVTLNEIDPDSMTFDPEGNLVLDNQGGSELVFISGVGTTHQYVTRLPLGTQVDDTIWPSAANGRLLVADTAANAIYALRTTFDTSTVYASTPNDSGVAGMVGTIDQATGIITPVAIGFQSPHGELFLPDGK